MARNKKFEKLGVNENYVNQEAVTSDAEYNNKKKSFFAFLQKLDKTEKDEKINIDTSEQENEKAHGEKFTYTRKIASNVKMKKTSAELVAEAPKAPFVLFLVCMCLSLAGALVLGADFMYELNSTVQNVIKIAISVCVYIIPAVIYVFWKKEGMYNFRACSVKYTPFVVVSLGLLLCCSALQKYLIAYVFSYRVPMGVQQGSVFAAICAGAIVPAVCEEFLVRGVLQHEFSKYAGGFGGVIFSSIAFTMLHFDLQYFGVYFTAGLILGTVVHVTKSILPAMIIHFLNNMFAVVLSDRFTFVALERIGGTLLIIALATLCFILFVVLLQMMEKISMHRAVLYLKGKSTEQSEEQIAEQGSIYNGKAKEEVILFTANNGGTAAKTARLFVNALSLVCYVIFLATVLVPLFK